MNQFREDSEGEQEEKPGTAEHAGTSAPVYVTIPAGTRISVRTIDGIDSSKNHVDDRFKASLEEPLVVNGNVVVAKGADVYGRLAELKESGTFTGKSQLRLELTGIVVNGTVPVVTGEYELSGKSRRASTAKTTVGAGAGAGSEIITKRDQVKVPSETLLDFTLQQAVSIPRS